MDLVTMLMACSLASDNSITKAMIDLGSQNKPLMVSVVGGETKTFPTEAAATNFANNELQQGHSINIGLMQISNRWIEPYHLSVGDMFKPCKNMVIATRILNDLHDQCLSIKRTPAITDMQACALSMYETGDPQQGADFASKIMTQAKTHPFVAPELTIGHPKPKADDAAAPTTPAAGENTKNDAINTALKPAATDNNQNAQR